MGDGEFMSLVNLELGSGDFLFKVFCWVFRVGEFVGDGEFVGVGDFVGVCEFIIGW